MNLTTICVHGAKDKNNRTGAVSVPIYQSATFSREEVGKSTGYDYSRLQNPTRESLEELVAALEGGKDALAFSTGMAAISTLMELFKSGDHIIASEDLYGGSIRLFHNVSLKNGITFDFVDTSDINNIKEVLRPNTKAIYIETPTNPMLQVTDLEAVSKIAKENNLLLIVDNTFLTPYFQKPIALGADIVIHSGTKYLAGHNDVLAGFLVIADATLSEKLKFLYKTMGACLSPFDSWLLIRSIKTLSIRLEKQQQNAIVIANWLQKQNKVTEVHYVGLETNKGYEICKKQATGFGSMISFRVDSEETARNILKNVKLVLFAESLGGVETLITYPTTQTHTDVPKAEKDAKGITETLLRISIGIEDVNDLISDLAQAIGGN